MTDQRPSVSAVGRHLDEEVEIAALAERYYEEAGRPEGHSLDFWLRAERELRPQAPPANPEQPSTEEDERIEEAMHLDQ